MLIVMILILIIAILGTPLFVIIGLTALINFAFTSGSGGVQNVILEITKISSMPMLHSIPLFTFAGYLLANSKASKRLVRITKASLGWMPGGLAIVTILACSVFTAFTGANGVTIVALGGLLLPALLSEKYGEKYSLGLITSSGCFGLLFPPSLPIIMFGVVASLAASGGSGTIVSIEELFVAGIVPGILITIILSLHAMYKSKGFNVKKTKFSLKELGLALWEAKWEAPLPILLFAGIFTGKLVISDAAVVTVVYILIVELFLTRDIKIKDLPKIMKESMVLVGAILIILCVSLAATNFMIYAQIPQKLFEFIRQFISNKWVFLMLLNIFLLIVGCLMDIFSALIVVVPLILPIAEYYNINLIHLGIIFLANLQIGYITPPVGLDLFVAAIRFNKPIVTLYRASIIFIGLMLLSVGLITYIPNLSIWFKDKPSIVGQWEYKNKKGKIDRISIKACNKYVRRQGDPLFFLLQDPEVGDYIIDKNKLILQSLNDKEEFKFEIFNNGKRLLLERTDKLVTDPIKENVSDTTSDVLNDNNNNLEDDNQFDDQVKEEKTGKLFYTNMTGTPFTTKSERFIAKWINESEDNWLEFYFDGTCKWMKNNIEKEYGYNIESDKIILIDFSDNSGSSKNRYIYSYKFLDSKNLILISKKDKNIKYDFNFTESNNDR